MRDFIDQTSLVYFVNKQQMTIQIYGLLLGKMVLMIYLTERVIYDRFIYS